LVTKALAPIALVLALAAPSAHALEWSDNSFHLAYGTAYREPFNPQNIGKTTLTYQHVDGYKWGSNFLNIDFLYSTSGEGDNVQGGGVPGVAALPAKSIDTAGAMEVYAVYRHTLSLNKVTSSKTFAFGSVVRDVGIVAGIDVNTKNHAFSSRKIMPIGGVALALNVPGFLNVELLANKEWGVNGVVAKDTSFDVTPTFAAAWGVTVYGPITFEGYGVVNLPKGNGGIAGAADTKTEVHLYPKLMVDVGQFLGSKGYQLGVGFEYWLNKFGVDNNLDNTGGSYAKTVFGEVAIHL
jgi:hypothetical protein